MVDALGNWVDAFSATELVDVRVFVQGQRRIAVFRVGDEVLAIDDRCPHEGYPLSKGFVNGCVLTCRWHSFRFDLRSGKRLVGDEPVRSYPVRMMGTMIQLDLAEPDAKSMRARYSASLSYPPRVRPAPSDAVTFAALRGAVEAEDAEVAEALVRTAIATGAPIAEWIQVLVSDHLLDIGHGFIFPPKVLALVERSPEDADLVLGALVRRIAHGTREELVPEWSWVTRTLNAVKTPDEEGLRGSLGPYIRALLDGTRQELFDTLEVVLASRTFDAIVDALVIAASVRVLRYDLQIEVDPTVQEGWLDVTHALTMASALRHYGALDAATRRRILYFASAFVHERVGLDAPVDLRVLSRDEEHTLFAVSASEPARCRASRSPQINVFHWCAPKIVRTAGRIKHQSSSNATSPARSAM